MRGASLAMVVLLCGALPARADVPAGEPARASAPAQPDVPHRRVLVLPGRDFRRDPEALFWAGQTAPVPGSAASELAQAAADALAAEPEVSAVRVGELRAGDGGGERGIVARGYLHLGQDLYRNLRQKDAAAALEKGVDAVATEFLDVVEPELVSDLYLYLGLSYLEQGSAPLAHVAFKNMFFVSPERRFRKGYFPPDTESAIHAAAVDFQRTYSLDAPLGSATRANALMRAAKVTAIVYAFLAHGPAGDRLEVRVVEPAEKGGGGVAHASGFPWQDAVTAREQVGRALSAWLACTTLPSRATRRESRPRLFMDTTGSYSLFLQHPTTTLFHVAGFGVGFAYQVLDNLDAFGRLNLSTSFPDRYGDLVEGFTAVRGVAGVGYSVRWGWGRAFLHTGFEAHYLSDFVSTRNANCKFFGVGSKVCGGDVKRLPGHVLLGMNGSVGVDFTITGPLQVVVQTGVSAYFYPIGANSPLNFPLFFEVGLGYAFL